MRLLERSSVAIVSPYNTSSSSLDIDRRPCRIPRSTRSAGFVPSPPSLSLREPSLTKNTTNSKQSPIMTIITMLWGKSGSTTLSWPSCLNLSMARPPPRLWQGTCCAAFQTFVSD
ncbi:hypothetical protein FOCG_17591 [Fusarium oxysporum f. sp. radicis-lycopersici 26381]|nr:hypothetical protein FOCG_17591 [Fusarium oxysporum f. sp. radicis-lycopersici 26381]